MTSAPVAHASSDPSPWVVRFAPLIRAGGRALDLACGRGRHARWLAAHGCDVLAVDREADALATLHGVARVATRVVDLEDGSPWPFASERFDAIVVVNYLHRPLMPAIALSLAGDGVLIYETFAAGNERYGRPSRPEFLLAPGELLGFAHDHRLSVVAFEQGFVQGAERGAVVQRIAATGPGRAWPPSLAR